MCCSVNGSVCLACCVFDSVVNCLVKQLVVYLGAVVILFLNVREVFSMGGGAMLDTCLGFCMSEVISSFKSLSAEAQMFALFMLFLVKFCILCGR